MMFRISNFPAAIVASLLITNCALAQQASQSSTGGAASDAANLAQQLSNPVADLVSVPLQFNFADGVGPDDATRTILNIQPVVPFTLNDNWNLIGRWIMPVVSQPSLGGGIGPSSGMGDIVFSTFFSPRNSGGLTWGVGPVLSLPVSTDPALGSGKWAAGPTFVGLKQSGPWTYGLLANYLWSFADATNAPRSDVSSGFFQPFLAYATPDGVTYSVNSETIYNSKASSGNKWTVPINFSISKITRFGPFPFSVGGGLGWYAEAPNGGPDWQLRAQFALILPRGQ
jgi:hypothetical protein